MRDPSDAVDWRSRLKEAAAKKVGGCGFVKRGRRESGGENETREGEWEGRARQTANSGANPAIEWFAFIHPPALPAPATVPRVSLPFFTMGEDKGLLVRRPAGVGVER